MLRKRLTTNDDDEGLFRIFTKLIRIESMREQKCRINFRRFTRKRTFAIWKILFHVFGLFLRVESPSFELRYNLRRH